MLLRTCHWRRLATTYRTADETVERTNGSANAERKKSTEKNKDGEGALGSWKVTHFRR